jgi:hypothetical protein
MRKGRWWVCCAMGAAAEEEGPLAGKLLKITNRAEVRPWACRQGPSRDSKSLIKATGSM